MLSDPAETSSFPAVSLVLKSSFPNAPPTSLLAPHPRGYPGSQVLSLQTQRSFRGSLRQALSLRRCGRAVAAGGLWPPEGSGTAVLPLHRPSPGAGTARPDPPPPGRCGPPGPALRAGRGGEAPPARAPGRHRRDGGSAAGAAGPRLVPRCRPSRAEPSGAGGEEKRRRQRRARPRHLPEVSQRPGPGRRLRPVT